VAIQAATIAHGSTHLVFGIDPGAGKTMLAKIDIWRATAWNRRMITRSHQDRREVRPENSPSASSATKRTLSRGQRETGGWKSSQTRAAWCSSSRDA